MKRRDLLSLGLVSFAAGALTPRFAMAQGRYPDRPIKLMVAFSAGGVNDVVARQWAERVKILLGTVYVENQGGGSGTIATRGRRTRAARRLYDPARQHQHDGAQPDDHGQGAVRARQGLRTHCHPRGLHHVDRRARIRAGENAEGAHRLCQGQSRQAFVRLRRHRHDEQSVRRAVQATHRPQRCGSHPVQGSRPGDHRSRQRTHPDDEPQCHRADFSSCIAPARSAFWR